MWQDDTIFLGASRAPDNSVTGREELLLGKANRHGLVTGATGTGKTVTLQILAEGFSNAGVPVFCADMKGDVAGLAMAGEPKDFLSQRAAAIGLDDYAFEAFPTIMWDVFGEKGHPVRATVTEMGPLLLSRLMGLTDAQEGVLNIAFRIADEEGLLLLDMKDLQSMLASVAERAQEISARYGNVTRASVGAIQRALLVLEQQGGDRFFGEPALEVTEFMRTARDGRGAINILAADRLMSSPRLYSTFLLWMLSELFEKLPEIGDPQKPRLVFFFDEAHLLFSDAPRALMERIEQVVRLIRSKGVGVYFVTQNPLDVPETVLAQLGNRFQHALRVYSPREQRAVKTAADTFRPNPDFDSFEAITKLGTGEALVSTLQSDGSPSIVQRTLIRPPSSRIGTLSDGERSSIVSQSPVAGRYEQTIDRESAYELLKKQAEEAARTREAAKAPAEQPAAGGGWSLPDFGLGTGGRTTGRASNRQGVAEAAIKSVVRSVGSGVGRAIVRGVLGSLKR
ncbi:DUF853 family protein [Chelativorans sp. ZYF759]|uniref:helicase HerA-like C-terminal domain-containing protein n=1 Tax=Chelativorans sp. ZYF759 TaxID=2692213 RepID=UPI00145EB578|nr:helicase HerA-like C-terminal domain-containing protein [Chelativorans sp. ZYF759]NMG38948.1 DUF853 family protein [Chelativorans sp. ZYF759]